MFAMSLPVFRDGGWFPDNLDWKEFRALVEANLDPVSWSWSIPKQPEYADFQLHEMIEVAKTLAE